MRYKGLLPVIMLLLLALTAGCSGAASTAAVAPADSQTQAQSQIQAKPPLQSQTPPQQDSGPAPQPAVQADPAKKAYLTFDDGPNSHFTGQVLDILKKYNVKASFAVIGSNVEKNPEVLKRIVDEGHVVVDHTYSHDYKKIYASPAAFVADLEKGNRAIASATGSEVKIFRAPGGPSKLSKPFFDLLKKDGYISLSWNVASADTDPKGVTPEQIVDNVEKGVINIEKMKKPPIILMHDGTEINLSADKPGTAVHTYIQNRNADLAALPVIIEFLQARGYTLAGVDQNTPPAW
jgi:peptidoglycan/xylan/chitin deacetylase (PgdA/CDA1 family)